MSEHDPHDRPIDSHDRPIETPAFLSGIEADYDDAEDRRDGVDAGVNQLQDPDVAEELGDPARAGHDDERISGDVGPDAGAGAGIDFDEAREGTGEDVAQAVWEDDR